MPDLPPAKRVPHLPADRVEAKLRGGGYAELHCRTNFSFLEGASHPDELVQRAAELGYSALAITDRQTLAGVVRAHVAAKEVGLKLLIGAEIRPHDAPPLVLWTVDRAGYGRLSRLITVGRRRAEKGECLLSFNDVAEHAQGLLCGLLTLPASEVVARSVKSFINRGDAGSVRHIADGLTADHAVRAREAFGDRCYLLAELHQGSDDSRKLHELQALSRRTSIPLAAANNVHTHIPARQTLQDVLRGVHYRCTVAEAARAGWLFPNAERTLQPIDRLQSRFAACPQAVARTLEIADRCRFSLDELRYEYPEELAPPGMTPYQFLVQLTWAGARDRYAPEGVPEKVRRLIEHELQLISELRYEAYFLTVWDLVRFARSRRILCQGRGSAANSAVCYCLGVTSVDPDRIDVLFERFVSKDRNEAPDIDVDFEHERREEVLQYIWDKYGRERAGMTAEVITYRPRSAVRDVGKALGLSLDAVDRLAKSLDGYGQHNPFTPSESVGPPGPSGIPASAEGSSFRETDPFDRCCKEAGMDPHSPLIRRLKELVVELLGFPRHLSQHVGGMVITQGPLCELVPIENAAMPGRTVIQWDKDDLDALGLLKVDCLCLGMLTAIRKGFALLEEHHLWRPARLFGEPGEATWEGEAPAGSRLGTVGRASQPVTRLTGENSTAWEGRPTGGVASQCRTDFPSRYALTGENSTAWEGRPTGPCPTDATTDPNLMLAVVPPEDPAVYDMICKADTLGVFQIESRAQMSMLPRLKPRCFYDLVIEVAIVRPGPIQGNMVHPYLRRRAGLEQVTYPNDAVKAVLHKTLGVPIFQEQAMRLAVVAAGFTPGEADQLRRAMGAWRKTGVMDRFKQKLISGMLANGYTAEYGEQVFTQIRGFGEYGFPESHSASFALLVYVSAWMKRYHPAVFATALLNSQPMGFYAPAQLVRSLREHGGTVRPVDVNFSQWDCTLEFDGPPRSRDAAGPAQETSPILRLGLRMIRGLSQTTAETIVSERESPLSLAHTGPTPYSSLREFARRTGLGKGALTRLARGDAFGSLGLDRRTALWETLAAVEEDQRLVSSGEVGASNPPAPPLKEGAGGKLRRRRTVDVRQLRLFEDDVDAARPALPVLSLHEQVLADYRTLSLSLRGHPMSMIREELSRRRVSRAVDLLTIASGRYLRVAGVVLVRQRPGTARGITFFTLEDETGTANLIVRPNVFDRYRRPARTAAVLIAHGSLERQGEIIHVMVNRLEDVSELVRNLASQSRDFK